MVDDTVLLFKKKCSQNLVTHHGKLLEISRHVIGLFFEVVFEVVRSR